jgi:hypothetical protein
MMIIDKEDNMIFSRDEYIRITRITKMYHERIDELDKVLRKNAAEQYDPCGYVEAFLDKEVTMNDTGLFEKLAERYIKDGCWRAVEFRPKFNDNDVIVMILYSENKNPVKNDKHIIYNTELFGEFY